MLAATKATLLGALLTVALTACATNWVRATNDDTELARAKWECQREWQQYWQNEQALATIQGRPDYSGFQGFGFIRKCMRARGFEPSK